MKFFVTVMYFLGCLIFRGINRIVLFKTKVQCWLTNKSIFTGSPLKNKDKTNNQLGLNLSVWEVLWVHFEYVCTDQSGVDRLCRKIEQGRWNRILFNDIRAPICRNQTMYLLCIFYSTYICQNYILYDIKSKGDFQKLNFIYKAL